MAIEWAEILTARFAADTGVSSIVADRIYPLIAPQGVTAPWIVFQVVDEQLVYSLSGYSNLGWARIQIDCYAGTYKAARDLGDAVAAVFRSIVEIGFTSSQLQRRELYEDATKLHRVSFDFQLWSNES